MVEWQNMATYGKRRLSPGIPPTNHWGIDGSVSSWIFVPRNRRVGWDLNMENVTGPKSMGSVKLRAGGLRFERWRIWTNKQVIAGCHVNGLTREFTHCWDHL